MKKDYANWNKGVDVPVFNNQVVIVKNLIRNLEFSLLECHKKKIQLFMIN